MHLKYLKIFILFLIISSLCLVSSKLNAQETIEVNLEWSFPYQSGITNPTTQEKDSKWFAPSKNSHPVIFNALPVKFGLGVTRDGLNADNGSPDACIAYDGILSGVNGCKNNDFAIGAERWEETNKRNYDKYIEFEFDIGDLNCYDFSESIGSFTFDAKRSKEGPQKIDVVAFADFGFTLKRFELPNSVDLTVSKNNYKTFSVNSLKVSNTQNLLQLAQAFKIKNIKIRIFGYSAESSAGTLRIDNFKLNLKNIKNITPNVEIKQVTSTCEGDENGSVIINFPVSNGFPYDLKLYDSNGNFIKEEEILSNNYLLKDLAKGEFKVRISDSKNPNCYIEKKIKIKEKPKVEAKFNQSTYEICEGENFTLPNPSNGVDGKWDRTFDGAGTYTFTPNQSCRKLTTINIKIIEIITSEINTN